MALNLKNSTTGLDTPIQAFQSFLYDKLKVLWPVDDNTLEGYGRVYRNRNDKGYVPELFISSASSGNTVYEPVFFDKTRLKAMFFFDPDDKQIVKGLTTSVNVGIIFIVNVDLLKGVDTSAALSHRGDEEIRNEVRLLCMDKKFGTQYQGEETGFKNVFYRFDGLVNKDGEVFEDRHPVHCFKIIMLFMYNPARNCANSAITLKN